VTITNKKRIQQWVDDYGEDSDFVKVRVRGLFPSAGSMQFISSELVEEAQAREIANDRYAPVILGVDVARFGDDESVIYTRIGFDARSWPARRFEKLDTVQLTGKVIEVVREFKRLGRTVAAIFVDGTGVGGGVVDQLRALGYNVIEVQFGSKAIDSKTYRYRSDEIWGRTRDAMDKLCLPADNEKGGVDLKAQLTQREFGYTLQGNKIHLETKKDMKARGAPSPDIADGLALTFAQDVAIKEVMDMAEPQRTVVSDYDPLEDSF